jgi:hypothetical protein
MECTVKKCRACKRLIDDCATKCQHCSSEQGWQRFLGNPLTIGITLTLISIWVAEPVKKFFDPATSEIKVSILSGDSLNIALMISNIGTRSAGITGISLKTEGSSATWYLYNRSSDGLIEPGKSYLINASNGGAIHSPYPPFIGKQMAGLGMHENCLLSVDRIEMDGTQNTSKIPFFCLPVDFDAKGGIYKDTE